MQSVPRLSTIGVYGFSEAEFFSTLSEARVELFCDVRARRGVRGSQYAFANSRRLQTRLAEMGIRYLHLPELAPSDAMRRAQYEEDARLGVGQRTRQRLGSAFSDAYARERLEGLEASTFVRTHFADARSVVLFCVEGAARACHRSLVADHLAAALGIEIEHLEPSIIAARRSTPV